MCEVPAVIRFLQAKDHTPAEIHKMICETYGPNVMTDSEVRKWCCVFQEEKKTNIHDKKI